MNVQNNKKKKHRLSLARKRKRKSVDENDREESNLPSSVESMDDHKNFYKRKPEVKQKAGRYLPEAEGNSKIKCNVLQMLQKPPQEVTCPVCGITVALCRINQHLDNECPGLDTQSKLHVATKSQCIKPSSCCPQRTDYLETMNSEIVTVKGASVLTDKRQYFEDNECSSVQSLDKECHLGTCRSHKTVHSSRIRVNNCKQSGCSFSVQTNQLTNRQMTESKGTESEFSEATCLEKKNTDGFHHKCYSYKGNCHAEESDQVKNFSDIKTNIYCEDIPVPQKQKARSDSNESLLPGDKNHYHYKILDNKNAQIVNTSFTSCEDTNMKESQDVIDEENKYQNKVGLVETGTAQDNEKPYYFANFQIVMETVLSNKDEASLFNDQDRNILDTFSSLKAEAKMLFIRLFQRKFGWFKCSKLDYPKISRDLRPLLKILVEEGFLKDEKELSDLKDVLHLIPAPELRNLAKSLHIIPGSSCRNGQSKERIMNAFLQHSDKQLSLFGSSAKHILKKAKSVLGPCVHVNPEARDVFCRLILLFSLNMIPEDEDSGQAQQLSTLFLVNIGRLAYPSYTIDKPTPVFSCREDLLRYAKAYQEKHEMALALEAGDLELAYSYFPNARTKFEHILETRKERDSKSENAWLMLPLHLRCFTAEWVHTKMCYYGVEVLQKMRRYEEAVAQLESLLQQDVLCVDSRGCWWDRLALNLQQHLRQPQKAYETVKKALLDPYVRSGRRLALVQRAKRLIASGKCSKFKDEVETIDASLLEEPGPPNEITITGKRSAQLGVFISHDIDKNGEIIEDTLTYCSVEEYTLAHFRKHGYDQGLHSEGSVFTTLYGLLMWDIIFVEGVPDVFRGPFQSAPLDIYFDCFYEKREALIQDRLACILSASVEELQVMLGESWETHEGQICTGVHWELFTGPDQAKQLVACFGGKLLAAVFEVFARDMRHTRSGLPDLVVWNSVTLDYRIVEVKGPGDRLSTKQQLWLDRLTGFGACAEVCYVTAVGGKKLRRL